MIQFLKKVSVLGVVLTVSGLGIAVGQNLSHQLVENQLVQTLSRAEPRSADSKSDSSPKQQLQDNYEYLELFNRVLQFVKANYVDEVKMKTLIEGAIKGM